MDLQELASAVMREEGRSATPFGLYVIPASDPRSELGRHVERAVFGEFFGETEEFLREEYDEYEPGSVFLVVLDHPRRLPAGVVRLIVDSPAGFKSLNDLERIWGEDIDAVLARSGLDVDPSTIWDVATIAVMPEYRKSSTNGLISLALVQGVITLAAKSGVELGLAVFDLVALDLIQAVCGRAWQTFAGLEPKGYLGSPSSIACYCDMQEFGPRLAFTDPDLYEMLWLGRGLEAGVSAPEWEADSGRVRAAS
ncbi:hypothetical protein [Rhabdothermincola salaria]|uniref:hypothetical protein n=1 Tax=Rhabdothermincola salaria TaxID=2903142 RepID=UPI001E405D71|nr:hypothetical protein [Rhabdothermincola salaria]MCD9622707.1 hypothetical protein [Rhabdothermincola salaria]